LNPQVEINTAIVSILTHRCQLDISGGTDSLFLNYHPDYESNHLMLNRLIYLIFIHIYLEIVPASSVIELRHLSDISLLVPNAARYTRNITLEGVFN